MTNTSDFENITGIEDDEELYHYVGAVCPYCGFINKGDCENREFYEDGDYIYTCDYCNKKFNMNTYISYHYTTSKISECEVER